MAKTRIDWDRFTHGSTDSYGDIDSLERIKVADERNRKGSRFPEGFPGQFTPNWWSLRKRYETLLSRGQGGGFGAFPPPHAADERELSDVAKCASLGVESAVAEYEAIDPDNGMHVHLSPALRYVRDNDPVRFAAIEAEALRVNALGRRRIVPGDLLKRTP